MGLSGVARANLRVTLVSRAPPPLACLLCIFSSFPFWPAGGRRWLPALAPCRCSLSVGSVLCGPGGCSSRRSLSEFTGSPLALLAGWTWRCLRLRWGAARRILFRDARPLASRGTRHLRRAFGGVLTSLCLGTSDSLPVLLVDVAAPCFVL